MKNRQKIYKCKVKQILFRDYVNENEQSIAIVESMLEKVALEKFLKRGYSEEAVAHEIYEKILQEYGEEPG